MLRKDGAPGLVLPAMRKCEYLESLLSAMSMSPLRPQSYEISPHYFGFRPIIFGIGAHHFIAWFSAGPNG